MNILSLFSGYNTFKDVAMCSGHTVISSDWKNYRNCAAHDIICDFEFFEVEQHNRNEFDLIMIGFPCNTFSKANPNFHFENRETPITDAAHKAIRMLNKLHSLLKYHDQTAFIIENPTSALFSNPFFKEIFFGIPHCFIRTNQKQFGHHVIKMTDLCTNMNGLFLSNPVHRVNGRYSQVKMENLTLKKRQSYPPAFVEAILDFSEKNFLNLLREKTASGAT